jgi:L-ascorbate metabolism protein UlaG (beta-lactamase superfamily)
MLLLLFRKLISKKIQLKKIHHKQAISTKAVKKLSITLGILLVDFAIHTFPDVVGLILEAKNQKIYLSRDAEYDGRLVRRFTKNCDLILICINGRLGNMSLEEALTCIKIIQVSILIMCIIFLILH